MKDIIIEKTKELLSGHCAPELKAAAEAWLAALGTEKEEEATEEYIFQLQDGIVPVEDLLALFGSEKAAETFGAEMAAQILAHAQELKEKEAEWCDCPACSKAIEILGVFDDMDEAGRMILEFEDDSKIECDIVCIFEVDGASRIVLLPDDGSEEVLIYGYKEEEDESFELYDLTDEEFEEASKAFDELLAE